MNIRPSPIAGTWYPGNPARLTRAIDDFLEHVDTVVPSGKIWGLVVPHAGYRYSGQVAAHAFSCLKGLQPDLVVVISPLHQMYHASLLTTAHDAYETPLGVVEVDRAAVATVNQALQKSGMGLTAVAHDHEHALEIELPFLQQVLGRFKLLPIMIRNQNPLIVQMLAQAVAETINGRNAILIASSDLSHFYPQALANDYDSEILRRVEAFDPQGVLTAEEEHVGFACGRGAIATVLWAAQALGANLVDILNYATSGDVTGKYDSVVGYGAAVIWQNLE
ncbi:MAG: AmmeMemoRadiSam system protein B [Ardenticatenaceae bacterium]|nr:AmmeMemoRadiSam system protein B [Ardenticatenaceae bacterium]MCB9443572.1 AmmeMemoRadiSam system protein B [Ardenticatenaceae bacterium]